MHGHEIHQSGEFSSITVLPMMCHCESCKMLHLLTKDSQLGTTATKSQTTKVSTATMTTANTAKSSIATTTIKTTKEKGICN